MSGGNDDLPVADEGEVESLYREALAVFRKQGRDATWQTFDIVVRLGEFLNSRGRYREADAVLQDAIRRLQSLPAASPDKTGQLTTLNSGSDSGATGSTRTPTVPEPAIDLLAAVGPIGMILWARRSRRSNGKATPQHWQSQWHPMAKPVAPDGKASGTRWQSQWHPMAKPMARNDRQLSG